LGTAWNAACHDPDQDRRQAQDLLHESENFNRTEHRLQSRVQFSGVQRSEVLAEGHVADDVDGQAIDPRCEIDEVVVLLRLFAKTGGEL
jgi:hypothetical protein